MVPKEASEAPQRIDPPFDLHDAVGYCLPDVNQDVAILHLSLLHLGRIVESSIQSFLVPAGLEISEHSVLSALWFAGPPHTMSPTQLSHVILQTTSGMSKTLKRIESLGFIERVADPHDGRSRLVVLTPTGRQLAEQQLRQLIDQWTPRLEGVDAADLSDITRRVWSLVAHMDPRFTINEDASSASSSSP